MQVKAINNQNTQPNFGSIFVPKNAKYTEGQREIVKSIIDSLQEKLPQFRNKTPEDYYKSKKGIDFNIRICNSRPDTIYLEGLKGVKITRIGKEEAVTFKEYFSIGLYDSNHPFEIGDIKKVIDANKEFVMPYAIPIFAGVIALFAVIGNYLSNQPKQITKPVTETIDTVSNKAKTILPDTIKVLKTIKK